MAAQADITRSDGQDGQEYKEEAAVQGMPARPLRSAAMHAANLPDLVGSFLYEIKVERATRTDEAPSPPPEDDRQTCLDKMTKTATDSSLDSRCPPERRRRGRTEGR